MVSCWVGLLEGENVGVGVSDNRPGALVSAVSKAVEEGKAREGPEDGRVVTGLSEASGYIVSERNVWSATSAMGVRGDAPAKYSTEPT
ncbi:hypothetical protein PspLS_02597 [Pyricularia sp. CBS 133598]|nr:hypothetical protein PspLS_02597 [Pyricularia sp. CBS 133598]